MISYQPFKRCLDDATNCKTKGGGNGTEFCFINHGDGTHEMDGKIVSVVVLHVTDEKLCEAIKEEPMDFRIVTMMLTELRGLSQKTVGHRFAIHFIDYERTIEMGLLKKEVAYLR